MGTKKARGSARAAAFQHKMAHTLDELAEYEQFRDEILPALRKMIKSGANAEEILKKFHAHAAARQVTLALTDPDSGKSLSAIKDILDRVTGKPKEQKKIEHAYSSLKDDELDSLLLTQASELGDDDEASH